MVDPGNIVHANDLTGMAVITQLQPITVVFTIPQDDIARVQQRVNTGEPVEIEAYDRDRSAKLATGTLMAIDNQVDVLTGTVRIKAKFANEDNLLFPNQFVNARLLIGREHDAVIVPTAAVQNGPDFHFVYVVDGDSVAQLHKVSLGPVEGDQIVITDGLAAGDLVVVDGIDKLQSGAKVSARERDKNAGSTGAGNGGGRESGTAGGGTGNSAASNAEAASAEQSTTSASPQRAHSQASP
jgi:multidrug efflux system membrane fusion protein